MELGAATPQLRAAVAALTLPTGYRTSFGGDVEQIAEAMGAVGSALLLAVIFGMLALAPNLRGGSGGKAPMAHALIGEPISSTAPTLLVVPVFLTYIDQFSRFARRFLPMAPDDAEHAQAQM